MALQWNANELAWARKHGVSLGAKTAGGLSTNAAYKRVTGGGGGSSGGSSGGGGGGNQVAVGGTMYDANQQFEFYNGYGSYSKVNAAQAAHMISKGRGIGGGGGYWDLDQGDDAGAFIKVSGKPTPQKKAAPRAEAPRPSGGGGGGGSRPAPRQSAPLQKSFQNIDNTMNKKANQALERDPYGIAKTKINQLAPETVRRSFLTNRGEEGSYSAHMVVDPKTGKAFNSAKDAKDAGVTNWVYKFQYDRKMGNTEEEETSALAEQSALTGEVAESVAPDAAAGVEPEGTTEATRGYKWRNRNTTNQWYKY